MIQISAIICSRDRVDLLNKAIASLAEQELAQDQYEIIIVDNSDAPCTSEKKLRAICPNTKVEYIFHPRIGLSAARNRGAKAASGPYLAFLDDDATASPNWLSELLSCFSKNPRAAVVGGKVIPNWSSAPPDWLMGELANNDPDNLPNHQRPMIGNLSIVNWADETRTLKPTEWLAGANIAFLKTALMNVGGFDENLGRNAGAHILLSNEESVAIQRIREDGGEVLYHSAAVASHFIPENRLKQKWFVQRTAWQVISDIFSDEQKLGKKEVQDALSQIKHLKDAEALFSSDLTREDFDQKVFTVVALLKLILYGHDFSDLP